MTDRIPRHFVRLLDGAVKKVENKNDALARMESGHAVSWWRTGPDPERPHNASRAADFSLKGDSYVEVYLVDDQNNPGLGGCVRIYGNGYIER